MSAHTGVEIRSRSSIDTGNTVEGVPPAAQTGS